MLDGWKQSWQKQLWVLVAYEGAIWGFRVIKQSAEQITVQKEFNKLIELDDANQLSLLVQVIPKRAKIIVSLPARLVQIQSLKVDTELSHAERHSFFEFQVNKSGTKDSIFTSEELMPLANESTNYLVVSVKRSQIAVFEQLVNQYRYQCIRLESTQATLAWLAVEKATKLASHLWGVIDLEGRSLNLLFFRQQQVLCQKSFVLDIHTNDPLIEVILQKIKLVISLLKLKQSIALFCSPLFFSRFLTAGVKADYNFHLLPDFESEYVVESSEAEAYVHYIASALAHKSNRLD